MYTIFKFLTLATPSGGIKKKMLADYIWPKDTNVIKFHN